jgi:hypothetical protein
VRIIAGESGIILELSDQKVRGFVIQIVFSSCFFECACLMKCL